MKIDAPGRILAGNADHPSTCIVQDVTTKGLRLEITQSEKLQAEFEFSFDNFQTIRRCRLIWLQENLAGAVFLQAQACEPALSEAPDSAPPLAPED